MKKTLLLIAYILCALSSSNVLANPIVCEQENLKEWTVLLYMNTDGLAEHAIANINAAASRIRSKTTNAFVFCNYLKNKAWLWQLKNGQIKQKQHYATLPGSHGDNLVNLMAHLKEQAPAKRYAIILWGHGSGVINMQLNPETQQFEYPNAASAQICTTCTGGKGALTKGMPTRGILYSDSAHTSMSNQEMYDALRRIKDEVLGRNLDALFTDACAMGNIEIAKEVGNYVDFFTGTQDCELADGLPYDQLFNQLNKVDVSGHELVTTVVNAYGDYHNYHSPQGKQTYVGLNTNNYGLNKAAELWDRFILFNTELENILLAHPDLAQSTHRLRENTLESSVNSDYVDLKQWLRLVVEHLTPQLEDGAPGLIQHYEEFCRQFDQVIIANITGGGSEGKNGLSIYYPKYWIHGSFQDPSNVWHRYLLNSTTTMNTPCQEVSGQWNILYYIQGNPDEDVVLREAILNGSLQTVGNASVFVEWHHNSEAIRWRLDGSGGYQEEARFWYDTHMQDTTMVSAAEWAFSNAGRRSALFLVGSGTGIVNMVWDEEAGAWDWPSDYTGHLTERSATKTERGIFYVDYHNGAMRSGQLVEACRRIKTDVLGGRSIDLLVADADSMASPELFLLPVNRTDTAGTSRLAEHVEYFVGSQDSVMPGSFDYNTVSRAFISPDQTTRRTAQKVVELFAENVTQFGYPATSMCAWHVPALEQAYATFDQAMQSLVHLLNSNPSLATNIYPLRGFFAGNDLSSDYIDIEHWLTQVAVYVINHANHEDPLVENFLSNVFALKDMHTSVVTANMVIDIPEHRSGVNIYFPQRWYDPSIVETSVAWGQFLHNSVEFFKAQ